MPSTLHGAASGKGQTRLGAKGALAAAAELASKQKKRSGGRLPLVELVHRQDEQQQQQEPASAPPQQRHSGRRQKRAGQQTAQQPVCVRGPAVQERVQDAQQGSGQPLEGSEHPAEIAAVLLAVHVRGDQGAGVVQGQAQHEGLEPATELPQHAGSDVSDAEWAELQRGEAAKAQRHSRRTGLRDAPLTKARAQQQAADHTAALAATRGSKRTWQPSWKVREAAAGTSQQQQRPRQRRRLGRSRSNGGVGGLDGFIFGGRGGASATYQPMQLLTGEEPLGLELYMGQARPMLGGGRAAAMPQAAGEGSCLEGPDRYLAAVLRARQLMGERMRRQGASEADVEDTLHLLRNFEAKCLRGEPSTPLECQQLCHSLGRRLREVYNGGGEGSTDLVLDAHVMSARALHEQEGQDDLQHMRVMQRRFVIWTPTDVPHTLPPSRTTAGGGEPAAPGAACAAAEAPAGAEAADGGRAAGGGNESHKCGPQAVAKQASGRALPKGSSWAVFAFKRTSRATKVAHALDGTGTSAPAADAQHIPAPSGSAESWMQQAAVVEKELCKVPPGTAAAAASGGGGGGGGGAWDRGLAGIWQEFTRRLQGMKYGDITLHSTDLPVSCALNDTEWRDGQLKRCGVKQSAGVLRQIESCQQGKRAGRLYVTDGSMPDYHQQLDYPPNAPGMPCGVDSRCNAMLPHAVRSSRATNLFHTMKNESTGTKTFTLFGPAGGGTNLTAFHFETKRRRSYNCGSGDFIIQPLATLEAMRKLMRVHAAVTGRHTRHGQLLPLEVYLEEGVPLVLHLRGDPHATLVELCEQSMHAFISFNTIASSPPALKVSCNDFDLVWELDSCYWMEKVACLYSDHRLLPEESLAADGADTWVMSSYLLRKPHTLAEKQAGWQPPWLCEVQAALEGQEPDAAGRGELEDGDMHWTVDIIAARCVEKMLDVLAGKLCETSSWAGEVPNDSLARQALRRARPVLLDMRRRAASEGDASKRSSSGSFQPNWPVECHFSREYVSDLLKLLDSALQLPADGLQQSVATDAVQGAVPATMQPPLPKRQRRGQQQQQFTAACASASTAAEPSFSGAVETCLPPADPHSAYAGSSSDEERIQLAQQADAIIAEGGAAQLPPAVLRSHWLLRVQLEWEAGVARDLPLLAKRRQQRSEVEGMLDGACGLLARRHQVDWQCRT